MRGRLFSATAALLVLLTALQFWSLLRAPAAWFPAEIRIALAPGEAVALGPRELAAPAAGARLQLRRDGNGDVFLRSLGAAMPVLHGGGKDQRMGSAALAELSRFQLGGAEFAPRAGAAADVEFSAAGSTWRYDGATLYRDGSAQPACAGAHAAARAVALWNRAMPRVATVARPLSFGGNVHCGNRIGMPGIPSGAALISRTDGQLQLTPGSQDDGYTALRALSRRRAGPAVAGTHANQGEGDGTPGGSADGHGADGMGLMLDLRQPELPLRGVAGFSIGRTRYQLAPGAASDSVTLLPSRHVALFAAPDARLAPQVSWRWRQRSLWDVAGTPLAAALAAAAICALAVASAAGGPTPAVSSTGSAHRMGRIAAAANAAAAALLLAAGVAAVAAQRNGHPASAACSLLLGAAALALWLTAQRRLPLPVAAALILLSAGLLAQLELGLGASASSWLRYYQKSTALLAIGAGAGGLWHCWNRSARGVTPQRTIEWLLAVLAASALAALAAQVLWGDETGVFDLQPVELAKLALTALTAHCLALRMGWNEPGYRQHGHAARWLQLAAPALLFFALLGLALVQVDDYSPLILLLVWSVAMAFAYAMASRNRLLAAGVAAGALLAVAAIATVRSAGADGMAQWPLAGAFYADRFQVWLAPAAHPHTGQQLLLGARAIAEGGWWGADGMLGLRSLGLAAGSAVGIPAVQDDFAPAFFLNRHGLLGALLLWCAQAALVAGVLHLAGRAYAAAVRARDFRQAWLGRFRYFALCGGAAFVAGHLLLSWGTNLAIFPIMGQPMSFLSAGGSHLLFFLCPLLAFCAVSAQSLEENESCRSTSNTKS